jgi:hypothetical protein
VEQAHMGVRVNVVLHFHKQQVIRVEVAQL